jgi:hypothetical protein
MTVAEAKAVVEASPGKWRAAFVEAPGTPLLDHPEATVRLHPTVKAATEELRARKESLVKCGYKLSYGTLGRGLMVFEGDDGMRAIAVHKGRRRG